MAKKAAVEAGTTPPVVAAGQEAPAAPQRAPRRGEPKVMVPIVVAAGQVVLAPKGKQYVAGDKVDVPAGLLEKNRKLAE